MDGNSIVPPYFPGTDYGRLRMIPLKFPTLSADFMSKAIVFLTKLRERIDVIESILNLNPNFNIAGSFFL